MTAVLLGAGASAPASVPATLDFLHVAANQGGSSGGHAALRIDGVVFEYQREGPLLRLRSEAWSSFEHRTRMLQNRPITLARVEVGPGPHASLRTTLERRLLVQERQLAIREDARRDVELLEALHAFEQGTPARFEVDGAGFFAPAAAAEAPRSLVRLASRIARERGVGFLEARRAELAAALAALPLVPLDPESIVLERGRFPVAPDTLSRRFADLGAGLAALDVLAAPAPLRGERVVHGDGVTFELGAAERARVRAASRALEAAMARLVASARPDWGRALLLGMARLVVLERSEEASRLVTLDAFSEQAERLELDGARRAWLPSLREEAADDLERARAEFLGGEGFDERAWRALEEAASRWAELRAAADGARTLRVEAGDLVPRGRAPLARMPLPTAAGAGVGPQLLAARAAARRYDERLVALAGYDLLRRNCVTELLDALAEATGSAAPASGRWVAPSGFVPRLAARRVRERWPVQEVVRLASHRERQLAAMAAREPDLLVALRESNVLTARSYQRNPRDGFFVFFGDGRPLLRPFVGALNLAAAAGRTGVGLLTVPFDGGRGLRAGARGALWSLPELVFASVRKGTNEYVRPAERTAWAQGGEARGR